jgi:hypothetical protein
MTTTDIQHLINNIGVDRVELDADKMTLTLNNGDVVECTINYPTGASDPSLELEYIDKN